MAASEKTGGTRISRARGGRGTSRRRHRRREGGAAPPSNHEKRQVTLGYKVPLFNNTATWRERSETITVLTTNNLQTAPLCGRVPRKNSKEQSPCLNLQSHKIHEPETPWQPVKRQAVLVYREVGDEGNQRTSLQAAREARRPPPTSPTMKSGK